MPSRTGLLEGAITEPRKRSLAYALTVNYAGMVCLAVAVNLAPLLLTTLSDAVRDERGTGLTKEEKGRICSAIFVGLVVGIVLTGPLADRVGAKPFAIAGSLLVGCGLAVLGFARSYSAVLGAAFVMGLGAGVLDMVLSPIVSALQPESRASAMNWLHAFYSIGAVAISVETSQAMALGAGWRTIPLALIPFSVLVALGFLGMRVPPLVAEGKDRMPVRSLCRERYFQVALAAILLAGCTELAMAQWLPDYAEKELKFPKEMAGTALAVFSAAMAIGRIAGGMLGHRVRATRLMLGCCGLAVCLYIVGSFAPWPPVALAACVAMGLAVSCLWPSMLALAAGRFPTGGASMFALLAALGNGGGIVMPWLVGAVASGTSMAWGMATGALPPLALVALLLWLDRRGSEPTSPSAPR